MKQMILKLRLLALLTMSAIVVFAQTSESVTTPKDTNTLQHIFKSGKYSGQARYFAMVTDNEGNLSDYLANAIGFGIGFESAKYKHFSFGVSGYFIYNLGSHNLNTLDPKTGASNRYEVGLFDIQNSNNKHDLDRLEDLYLKFNRNKINLKLGKQHIKQPFINPQDGRMRSTLIEGLTMSYQLNAKLNFEGGYLFGISPRSTVKWFSIDESFGIYPSGVNLFGSKSSYAGNTNGNAIYYGGINYLPKKSIQIYGFNQWVNKVFNTTLIQAKFEHTLKHKNVIEIGLQGIHQFALEHGGNANQNLSYMLHSHKSYTYGARLNYISHNNSSVTLNYNHITKHGQYLMPREWGRDPFFTFLPRERNEGFANVHAGNISISHKWPKQRLKLEATYGRYYLPDVKNTWQNKYGMPSYSHTMFNIKYAFAKFLKGLDLEFLYIYKAEIGNTYQNDKYVLNKVNMSNVNLILNYSF